MLVAVTGIEYSTEVEGCFHLIMISIHFHHTRLQAHIVRERRPRCAASQSGDILFVRPAITDAGEEVARLFIPEPVIKISKSVYLSLVKHGRVILHEPFDIRLKRSIHGRCIE